MPRAEEKREAEFERAIAIAERASMSVRAPALRARAFDRVLQRLLMDSAGASQPLTVNHEIKRESRGPRASTERNGPMGWLEQLIDDGFFDQPQGQREILEKLLQRGRLLKDSQITQQLLALVRTGRLSRQKVPLEVAGQRRDVWKYRKT